MTFVVKDIADHLKSSTTIAATVENRIFPDVIPQEERDGTGQKVAVYPCIVLGIVSGQPEYDLAGEAGVHQTTIQVDCYTDGTRGTYHANELAEQVRNRLSGYRGQFGDGCSGTARLVRVNAIPVEPADGSDTFVRRTSMDFELIHTADAPTFS